VLNRQKKKIKTLQERRTGKFQTDFVACCSSSRKRPWLGCGATSI